MAVCLVVMGAWWRDRRQQASSPFHIVQFVTVVVVGVHKSANNSHGHYPLLKASKESLGDEIVE